jgi:hypothetical protein
MRILPLVSPCILSMHLLCLFDFYILWAQVIVATAERCLDPIPLEPPILDKLVQAKLAKTKEQNTTISS